MQGFGARIGLGWTTVTLLCLALTEVWPDGVTASIVGFAVAFAALSIVVMEASRAAARDRTSRRHGVVVSGFTLAALAVSQGLPWPAVAGWLAGLGWLVGGGRLGAALGHGVESATYIWPLVIVALGADIWSVTAPEGVTHQVIVQGQAPALAELIVLQLSVPGVGQSPILGIGDILFSALLLGAVDRLELSMRRALVGMGVGFFGCLVALVILAVPIPALPLLGVGTAVALGGSIRPRWREMALAVGLGVAVLLVGRLLG